MGEMIGPAGTEGNLDPLNGVHDKKAEFTIKDIMLEDQVKISAGLEAMSRMILLERQPISRETVIVEMG